MPSLADVRMRSSEALSPRIIFTALMMMDFPVPVSPVRTFNPLEKEISSSSMMAKSLICNAESMLWIKAPFTPIWENRPRASELRFRF